MGKRKLNSTTFFQCDWSGFPMKSAHCYWPSWSQTGKLLKKGSYCNWESVVAAVDHELYARPITSLTAAEGAKIKEHIAHMCGTEYVKSAPHFDDLAHTKGKLDAQAFHEKCVHASDPIMGVKIAPDGDIYEVLLVPVEGRFKFGDYLHPAFNYPLGPSTFHSMRKKGSKNERDMCVWHLATKELPPNPTASNLFKMQLYGDVLLIQQSREQSFLPRERYISFTKAMFDEQFTKKRKRPDVQCMSMSAYESEKARMQQVLNQYEKEASKGAEAPKATARAPTMAPTNGKSLASAVKQRATPPSACKVPLAVLGGLPVANPEA